MPKLVSNWSYILTFCGALVKKALKFEYLTENEYLYNR